LASPSPAAAEFAITEIMAAADVLFPDEDGAPSDWIEVTNGGGSALSLGGYSLTSNPADLRRWVFPDIDVGAGASVVVFASGKDRSAPGGQLHTNFTLDRGGNFLALVNPDGTSIASDFGAGYPEQFALISYGSGTAAAITRERFVAFGSTGKFFIAEDDTLGDSWKGSPTTFDDSGWTAAPAPLGFDSSTGSGLGPHVATWIKSDMRSINASGYFRFQFDFDAASNEVVAMQLSVTIDAGFVAYLNGTEIGSFRKPDPFAWNSAASSSPNRLDSVVVSTPIVVDVTSFHPDLLDGENVLAIQGMASSIGSSDFIIDAELTADVRDTSGGQTLGYFETPTPGEPNGTLKRPPPAAVAFSEGSRLFTDPFELTLSCATPGATIRYTTDLSVPSDDIGDPSPEYSDPISIDGSTQVRARAFVPGSLAGPASSETFLKMSAGVAAFSSDLPVVVQSTLGGGTPPGSGSTTRKPSYLFFFEPDPQTGRTRLTQVPQLTTRAGVRKRGNSSSGWPKYPMSIEFWQDIGLDLDRDGSIAINEELDNNLRPMGMNREADWVLSGRYQFDLALMRNTLMYDLSNLIGRYAARYRYVELYNDVNGGEVSDGDYFGIYVFMERIEADPNRVDVARIKPWENSAPEVTGGYIFKRDWKDPGGGAIYDVPNAGSTDDPLVPSDPDGDTVTAAQEAYIEQYLSEMTVALMNDPSGINPATGLHFSDYLDVDSFIDHHCLNLVTKNLDWGRHSSYFYKDRGGVVHAGPIWDYDRALGSEDGRDENPVGWDASLPRGSKTWSDSRFPWFGYLLGPDPARTTAHYIDVRQRHTDRWFELRKGSFSVANLHAMIDALASELAESAPRNFARWSELPLQGPYPGPLTAQPPEFGGFFAEEGTTGWDAEVSHLKGWIKARVAWIDSQYVTPPTYNTPGGLVTDGFDLTMSSPGVDVWYTDDGSDPRAPGGGMSPGAVNYDAPLVTESTQIITARSLVGSDWSAPEQLVLVVSEDLADDENIVVSELMYHPANPTAEDIAAGFDDADLFEFAEILNIGVRAVALIGMKFIDGIEFDFNESPTVLLQPGGRALLVKDRAAFEQRYGDAFSDLITGEFQNGTNLRNSGERVILQAFGGGPLRDFTFDDSPPWPTAPDGGGYSLVLIAPETNPEHRHASSWRSSVAKGGSPGFADTSNFATWATDNGGVDASSDDDQDGRDGLAEYAMAGDPNIPDAASSPSIGMMAIKVGAATDAYPTLTIRKNLAADDVEMVVQKSDDLSNWTDAGDSIVLVEERNRGDGSADLVFRTGLPLDQLGTSLWLRVHMTLRQ